MYLEEAKTIKNAQSYCRSLTGCQTHGVGELCSGPDWSRLLAWIPSRLGEVSNCSDLCQQERKHGVGWGVMGEEPASGDREKVLRAQLLERVQS